MDQLFISQSNAAMTMGLIICIGSLIGAYSGAFLFNLKKKRTLPYAMKLFILTQAVIMVSGFGFFLYCPQRSFDGVTENRGSPKSVFSLDDLRRPCNSGCKCTGQIFTPVCGSNKVNFFSPCYAGCSVQVKTDDGFAFEQCGCVEGDTKPTAEEGFCASDCQIHIPFIAILATTVLILHMPIQPTITVTKNATASEAQYYLEDSDDTETDELACLGFSLQLFIYKLAGSIPGPILFGYVINKACLLYDPSTCLLFNNNLLAWYTMAFLFVTKLVGIFLALVCFFISRKMMAPPTADADAS